jgi:hypothetical protein
VRARFLLRLLVLIVVGWVPWPGLGNWVARVFSAFANVIAGPLARYPEAIEFRPEGPGDSFNAILSVTNRTGIYQEMLWDLRRAPYLPVAVFLALSLALPMRRLRPRLLVIALGVLGLPLISGLRLLLAINSDSPIRLLELPASAEFLLTMACRALVLPPGMAYALPAMTWLTLSWWLDRSALSAVVPLGVEEAVSPATPAQPARTMRPAARRNPGAVRRAGAEPLFRVRSARAGNFRS